MINLLPPDQKEAIKFGRLNTILIQYVVLAIVVTIALLGVVIAGSQKLSSVQSDIRSQTKADESKVQELSGYQEEAKKIADRVNTLSNLFDREVKFSELLTSIGGVMPSGSALTQLSLSEDRTLPLNLTASVKDEATAAVLRKNLEESDIFDKADIISITADEDVNSGYKFQVTITAVFTGGQSNVPQEGDYI